jgi:2-hydroxychromene-2-carboxylate isomerase
MKVSTRDAAHSEPKEERRPMVIEYYFSVLSDWAYMGGERLESLARRYRVNIDHKPMRLATIYAGTGGILLQKRSKQRQDYRLVELKRWSKYLGIPVKLFPKYYPTQDELASCIIIAAKRIGCDAGLLANAILRAIWAEDRDISQSATLAKIADGLGMDGARLLEIAKKSETVGEFDRYTEQAQEQGVFGSPFYLFDKEIFWGQDRLQFLEDTIANATATFALPRLIPETQGVNR